MDAVASKPKVTPFSLRDAPSLIERVWPAQKISVETKREFDAHGAQTLTPLGSYWKGRKRLVYVRACVLGSLLPATDDPLRDLDVFEKLMAIDDGAFLFRETKARASEIARMAIKAGAISEDQLSLFFSIRRIDNPDRDMLVAALRGSGLQWNCADAEKNRLRLAAYSTLSYQEKVDRSLRPEELPESAYESIWENVNSHLGTNAHAHSELVEQLGFMRFGHRPKVADTFCGSGAIPFEAARMGCDVYASDLNPIACMLTWGALHLIGGGERLEDRLEAAQASVASAVDRRLLSLGVEEDSRGNRSKAYLYCVEAKCPTTGWLIPLMPSLIISKIRRAVAKLVPNHKLKRLDIAVESNVSATEMEAAKKGTVQNKSMVYELDGEVYRTPIASIRGDYRLSSGETGNKLRKWGKNDFFPREDDIFGERLYCIQWITKKSLNKGRQETFFATPNEADRERDAQVVEFVRKHLAQWQEAGFVPDMPIEDGLETTRLRRERGWTFWHHLYAPRQLLIAALVAEEISKFDDEETRGCLAFERTFLADKSARLSQWRLGSPGREGRAPSADGVEHVFYNQALNTFYNFGARAFYGLKTGDKVTYRYSELFTANNVETRNASSLDVEADIFITDPPYADAIAYHEITEFFIAWLRKNPPRPFADWVWDSRRTLAVKGSGDDFRRTMVSAYSAMARGMPENGMQIVMFTHTDLSVWADMASIFWGAGLQVAAAWYVSTETRSETKKGGYVQGTVTLALRKRLGAEIGYKDEIVQEVKLEVAEQIDTMAGLSQALKGHGRIENLFEDADLQMAGYAAALRVLTRYAVIDDVDMAKEASRPRPPDEKNLVSDVIEFAVQVANEHMVPEGMNPKTWENLAGAERFYFKMMDIETTGAKKLDNYQNFAKAFRVPAYDDLMGNMEPNKAALKTAEDFKKSGFEVKEFGPSKTRALLYAVYEVEKEVDGNDVLSHLRDLVPDYFNARDDLMALAEYVATKRETIDEEESRAARILNGLIRNERFG